MIRTLLWLAVALSAAAAPGCQNPAWHNPYAMIGPATVPPPGAQTGGGLSQPPAAAAATSARAPAAGGPIRSEISAAPRTGSSITIEEPIRIVEAAPATKTTKGSPDARTVPPIIVAATPTGRSTAAPRKAGPAPAVKLNPSPPATSSPATSRTRGFLAPPAATPPAATPPTSPPKNRLSTPGVRQDAAVTQATFIEMTQPADGQWKAR